jgi:uncharacterized protein YjbJ (UPF0337 family)
LALSAAINNINENTEPGRISMADKHIDEGKGRIKQAAGSLTDDQSLKNEGKVDQAKASIKDKVDKVADALTAHDKK